MGQEWWDTVEDGLDYLLEPAGATKMLDTGFLILD